MYPPCSFITLPHCRGSQNSLSPPAKCSAGRGRTQSRALRSVTQPRAAQTAWQAQLSTFRTRPPSQLSPIRFAKNEDVLGRMYRRSANVSAGHGGPEQPPGGRNCHLLMWALSFPLHTTSGVQLGELGSFSRASAAHQPKLCCLQRQLSSISSNMPRPSMKVNMTQDREKFDKSASSHAEGYKTRSCSTTTSYWEGISPGSKRTLRMYS